MGTNDRCCMRTSSSELKASKFIFYDFECQQTAGIYKYIFLKPHTVCYRCKSKMVICVGPDVKCLIYLMKRKMKGISALVRVVVKDMLSLVDLTLILNSSNS